MKLKHALIALIAVAALVGIPIAVDAATTNATCTPSPTVTDTGTGQRITVVCTVPKPPPVTVTSTVTATATVTASPSPTPSPSGSPSPTVNPTPTPTPSPTPTSTPTVAPGGFPDASNTGVPAGTVLTAYTGPSTITTAGTVIDGKTMGCITVAASGVVIRNSHISCANTGGAAYVDDRTSTSTLLTIEDSEIDCKNTSGTAVGEADVTVRRTNIHGCENGFDANQNITVEDSYIHDLYNTGASHTDGIQLSGHFVGTTALPGALNITIRHNTIYGVGADGSLGTSSVISNPKGDVNILIADNLFGGGAYTLYCDYQATATNYRVTGNHFTKRWAPKYGAYGPSDGCADESLSGNVDHETGQPVQLD